MKTIVISITVPDDAIVQVGAGPAVPPSDFEHEPLPTETYADAEQFVGGAPLTASPAPLPPQTNGGLVQAFRGAAMQQPSTAGIWQVGGVHEQGHKPLKAGQRGGLFCPTKLGEDAGGKGVWCQFKV